MGFRFRRRPALGPLRFNVTERGLRSVSIKVGPFTWNPRRQRLTTDLPDGLYHEADLRPWHCRCAATGCPAGGKALMHDPDSQACTACPCTRYRRTR